MDLSVHDRKILWGKAGSVCSYRLGNNICFKPLFQSEGRKNVVTGQECHIVGKKPGSARYLKVFPQRESYDNAILMCPEHHKVIDDESTRNNYPADLLHKMKDEHESTITEIAKYIRSLQNGLLSEERITERGKLAAVVIETALMTYRCNLAQDYQYADHRGVEGAARAIQTASLPLDDVYVMPDFLLKEELTNITDQERGLLNSILYDRDLPKERKILLEEQFVTMTANRWHSLAKDHENKGLPLGEILKRFHQVVVIGGPGLGKSLLTRYLGRTYALGLETMQERFDWEENLIPIVISLAAFADAQTNKPGLTLREYLDECMSTYSDFLCPAISAKLMAGEVFVMLDGLDEVPSSRKRAALVQAVEAFISQHRSNRFLITSRPYGYIPITGEFAHFQMLNFSDSQIDDFVYKWQQAIECKQHPAAPNLAAAKLEAEKILQEIRRNQKISELATNPLMLVIISLIRQESTRLPDERVRLYNRAVNTLLDTWNQWRSALGNLVNGEELPLNRLIAVLGAIAEWSHRNKPTGIMHRADLKRELIRVLTEKEFEENHPEVIAESYLNAAAHRAGLLEERGPDIFAFWHPTFEEYLAAVDLTVPSSKAIDRLIPLRDDPRWREVLLLAVGYVGVIQHDEETATEIVRAIANRETGPFEPLYHSYLRIAAACIAEDVGVKRTLAQEIISRMARALRNQHSDKLKVSFTSTIWALPQMRPTSETISALAPLIGGNFYKEKAAAVRLLINVIEDSNARELCEQALSDHYRWVSFGAAVGLVRCGDFRPEVWKALAGVGEGSVMLPGTYCFRDEYLAGDHIRLLEEQKTYIARAPKEALASLRLGLNSDDLKLRIAAAWLLHTKDSEAEAAINALIICLSSDSLEIQFEAARMLLQLGKAIEQAEQALVKVATKAKVDLCISAAELLILNGRINDQIKNLLFAWLDSEDDYLAMSALILFEEAHLIDNEVIEKLFSWLDSESDMLSHAAMNHLMWKNKAQSVTARFKVWLEEKGLSSKSQSTRYISVGWLVDLGDKNEALIKSLKSLLKTEYFDSAIRDLNKLGVRDENIVSEVYEYFKSEATRYDTKFSAATELCNLGHTKLAVETVVKMIDSHPEAALSAIDKVIEREALSEIDSQKLIKLISTQDEDGKLQKHARSWLFNWLERQLETRN